MLGKGDIVGGRYRLEKPLGEGGTAQVFEAKDLTLDRHVAVKLLFASDERHQEELSARFLREAKISAAVRHQHVISIVDFGISDDATPYMVMELLEGILLADRLENDVVLKPVEAIEMGVLILRGLAAVHRSAIVHRDLKPENIFLVEDTDSYVPKILDFGISRSVDPGTGRESAYTTKDGLLVGTPDYMSPEQVRGLSDIDTRTDIYSMGVILYEAIAGRLPFESENPGDLMILIAAGNAPECATVAPWVPEALSKVIARAMARRRENRYQTAREMLEALIEVGYDLDLSGDMDVTGPFRAQRSSIPPPPRNPEEIHDVAESITRFHKEERRRASSTPPVTEAARPSRVLPLTVAALLVAAGAVGVVLFGGEGAPAEPANPVVASAPQTAATPTGRTDEVVLTGVPAGATIRLDDAVTPHPVVVVRDQEPHVIEVAHPGRDTWRVTHVADGPMEYAVTLPERAGPATVESPEDVEPVAEVEPAASEESERTNRRSRRRRGRMSSVMTTEEEASAAIADPDDEPPMTFRMLDY